MSARQLKARRREQGISVQARREEQAFERQVAALREQIEVQRLEGIRDRWFQYMEEVEARADFRASVAIALFWGLVAVCALIGVLL